MLYPESSRPAIRQPTQKNNKRTNWIKGKTTPEFFFFFRPVFFFKKGRNIGNLLGNMICCSLLVVAHSSGSFGESAVRVSCFDNVREVGLSEDGLVTENLHTHILFGQLFSDVYAVCVCVSNVTRGARSGRRRFQSVSYCCLGSLSPPSIPVPLLAVCSARKSSVTLHTHTMRHLAPFDCFDGTKHLIYFFPEIYLPS